MRAFAAAAVAIALAHPFEVRADAHATNRFWLAGAAHVSALGDRIDRPTLLLRFGYAVLGGYRWGRWGVFAQVEHDVWAATEVRFEVEPGVVDAALGGELLYFDRRVRASVALGAAVLLEDQAFDDAPHAGIFFEVRPTGLRWRVGSHWTAQLDPLGFAVVAPVLGGRSIVDVEYRTTFTLEWERETRDGA